MAKRDILKEAIADAKAVKEVAIANAKAALEEAFTPQLKSILATKIQEMDKDEDEEEKEQTNEKLDMRHKDDKGPDRGAERKSLDSDPKFNKKKDLDEEVDLDEILAEIEEADESEAERADVDKYEYEEGKEEGEDEDADEAEDEEAEEIDLEDMTDEDLKVFIEDVISDMVSSGELEAGESFEEEDVEDIEVDDTVDIDVSAEEEVELEESKKGNKDEQKRAEGAIADDRKHIKKLKGDLGDQEKKLAKLKKDAKKELDEAYKAVNTLRSELSEVNLLNVKLLYTNKIFKSKNLTEKQKVKVLGAFDNATTVKESKLVFETLNEGLKAKKKPLRESLGSASRSTGTTKTKKPIIDTDPMVSRFQKLAGIN